MYLDLPAFYQANDIPPSQVNDGHTQILPFPNRHTRCPSNVSQHTSYHCQHRSIKQNSLIYSTRSPPLRSDPPLLGDHDMLHLTPVQQLQVTSPGYPHPPRVNPSPTSHPPLQLNHHTLREFHRQREETRTTPEIERHRGVKCLPYLARVCRSRPLMLGIPSLHLEAVQVAQCSRL